MLYFCKIPGMTCAFRLRCKVVVVGTLQTLVRKNAPTMDNIIKDTPFQSGIVEEILSQLAWFMDGIPA